MRRKRSLKAARVNFERAYILTELRTNDWNVTRAAERLGIERSYLYRKLKALTTTVVRTTRDVRAPRDVRITVHRAPEPAPWVVDEFLESGRHEHGGAACCLDCRREIVASEVSITLKSLPADQFCLWCARPR